MSYSSKQTKQRILKSAKSEFLSKGFLGANMREIAKSAKVTTGAMYNHFQNKEMLFEAIVGIFADEMLSLFIDAHNVIPHDANFFQESTRDSMMDGSFDVLGFIYSNLDEAKLLFFNAAGTKYEKFTDKLIEIEEIASIKSLEAENFEFTEVNRFFVHVMSTSGVNNMLEAVHHDLSREDAFKYMEQIQRFYYAGVKEMLGQ